MIVWQGAGFAGVLIPFIFVLLGQFGLDWALGAGYYSSHAWAPTTFLLASALVLWWCGKEFAKQPGKEMIDPRTQQTVIIKDKHTIFFMPLHYFSMIVAAFAIGMLFT